MSINSEVTQLHAVKHGSSIFEHAIHLADDLNYDEINRAAVNYSDCNTILIDHSQKVFWFTKQ